MGRILHADFRLPDAVRELRSRTGARIAVGRAGTRPTTAELLKMRIDHAAACDAVRTELSTEFVQLCGCSLDLSTQAEGREGYLLNPPLGRLLRPEDRARLTAAVPACDVLVAVGDGLSSAAAQTQAPLVLPVLLSALELEGVGKVAGPVLVRNARVGVMNDLGEATQARVVVLLVGERPGLSTAESLSIYIGYDPRPGRTDAERNVLSNIHAAGIPPAEAAAQAASWVKGMLDKGVSGVDFKP